MTSTFNERPREPAHTGAVAAEIKALDARRQAYADALVRLSLTPGVAATLSLFR